MPFYSSQEWAKTVVDTQIAYLGMWGMTVHSFNYTTKEEVSTLRCIPSLFADP